MNFDDDQTARELKAAFRAYEDALMRNDVEKLVGFFWNDPRAVRLSPGAALYGIDQIANFRQNRDVTDVARELLRVDILPLGTDAGVVNCEYRRLGSGRLGAQSQVWVKFAEGWRIVSAHVGLAPAPRES